MITQETQKQIEDLVRSARELAPERQVEEATTFLMYKALELAHSLGGHKDINDSEYAQKRQEYLEVEQRLGEIWHLPSSRSINAALVNLEMTLK